MNELRELVDKPFSWRELLYFAFIPTGGRWQSGFSIWIGPVLITVDVSGWESPYHTR